MWYNGAVDKPIYRQPFRTNLQLREELIDLLKKERRDSLIAQYFTNKGVPCDRTSISHWREKLQINLDIPCPRSKIFMKRKEAKPPKEVRVVKIKDIPRRDNQPLEDELLGERLNPGKQSYKDYVKDAAERGEKTAIHILTKGFPIKGI